LSLLTGGLGWWLGYALFGQTSSSRDWIIVSLLFSCVGGVVGGIAGAAREIVAAHRLTERSKKSSEPEVR
jgi:hypothetical protein